MNDGVRPVRLGPGEGRPITLGPGGVVTMKVEGRDSGGTLSAYEFTVPPRTAGPPLHLHRGWDEAFYVLDGEMTFIVDGRTHTAAAGSLVFVPRGVLHTFWNQSDAPARQLTVFTPAGIEDYFDAVSSVLDASNETGLADAEALMTAHDMIVPPGTAPAYGALTRSES